MRTNNYIKLSAECTEKLIAFLVQTLEFEIVDQNCVVGNVEGTLLNNPCGDEILVVKPGNALQTHDPIVINTADCLKSCFQLSANGVKIIAPPYYTHDGLAAAISDEFGNSYLLLERRSLIES